MPRPPRAARCLLLVAAAWACGGPQRFEPVPAEGDFHIAEAIYADSVWPVERHMCRAAIPDVTCREACRATHELDDVSLRLCRDVRGFADDPAGYRRCREGRMLAKRATTACSFCRGEMTRRPCHDLF